jgi:F-type H+-transporting ATPase subunit epsilon
VRGGLLTVKDGATVEVATRDAVGEDTLRRLGRAVLSRFREEASAEEESRTSATRLHLAAIRQLQRYLESARRPIPIGQMPSLGPTSDRSDPFGDGERT